jgi:hypothetical protein
MAKVSPGRYRSLSAASGRGPFRSRGFFHRGRKKRPGAIRGLSTRGASAMIGVHRIGGEKNIPVSAADAGLPVRWGTIAEAMCLPKS